MHKTNILEYLEESALIRGGKTALIGGECSLSFADLKSRAEAIGCALLQKGFYRKAVAVLMDKHPDTVCAFLGVLYAGCFYICIEPDEPEQRILSIIDRARVEAVICNEKSRDSARILRGRAEIIELEEALSATVDKNALQCVRARAIDTDPAYIVFTSGSTGEPKGVCASHRSVIDYAEAICKTLGFDESTVFGNQAPLYYDAPLKELLPCLMLGATVHFIPRSFFCFPQGFANIYVKRGSIRSASRRRLLLTSRFWELWTSYRLHIYGQFASEVRSFRVRSLINGALLVPILPSLIFTDQQRRRGCLPIG